MRLKNYNVIAFLFLMTSLWSQEVNKLEKRIIKSANSAVFNSSNLSVSVFDIAQQKEIAGYRAQKVLSPASSLKLLTTFTALKHLGADYQFQTIIGYEGSLRDDGTLNGNLIIKGGGDPTLGSDKVEGSLPFRELLTYIVKVVAAHNINCIKGKVIVDESIFDSYPVAPSWQWNDLGNYYASGAWGLNIHENQYYIYFKDRSVIGNRPTIHSISPRVPRLNLSNEIVVDSSHTGDQAYIFGGPYNYDKRVVGTIPQGTGPFSIKGSLPDPPAFFAEHLRIKLSKANIQSEGATTRFRSSKKRLVAVDTILSPPLSMIVKKANVESNNLYTESLLKLMGLKKMGQGSGQNGLATIIRLLRKYKVNTKEQIFHDGSGLSARNQISSQAIAKFLSGIANETSVENCTKYLPRGGYAGTVKGMFGKSAARGNVWLKSGSMSAVQSYSGYVKTKSGKWCSFSIIVNGFSQKHPVIRKKLERMISDIYHEA